MPRYTGDELWRLAIAFHEAGHAVIHKTNGGRVKSVTLLGIDDGGYTTTAEDGPDHGNPLPWLAMLMAGYAAEYRFLTRNGVGSWKADSVAKARACGDRTDFRADGRGTGISRGRAVREATRLVNRHWGRIERAAHALSARGRLSGSQI